MSIISHPNHTRRIYSDPRSNRRHEIEQRMLQSYTEGADSVDAEMQAAMRRGYVPIMRPGSIRPQLSQSLQDELDRAVDRILEHESNGEDSATAKGERIMRYLQKQAYLTGAASRRSMWGENLVFHTA